MKALLVKLVPLDRMVGMDARVLQEKEAQQAQLEQLDEMGRQEELEQLELMVGMGALVPLGVMDKQVQLDAMAG